MRSFLIITFSLICRLCLGGISDPVADYLKRQEGEKEGDSKNPVHFITYGGLPYYSSDKMYRFDIDLNQDGKKEVLISSSLERDGRQGNVFHLYKQVADGFEDVGELHLYPNGFYLGKLDEIDAFGIVKFWPSGGGEGGFTAYIFDGEKIIDKKLGGINRNRETHQLEGRGIEIAAKYSISVSDSILDDVERLRKDHGYKAPDPSSFVSEAQVITSKELAEKYGVKVEPKTYQQALQENLLKSASTETPSSTLSPTPVESTPAPKPSAMPTILPAAEIKQSSSHFPIAVGAIVVVMIIGLLVFVLRRKS